MKTRKILLATTALCMAAGTAAADIVLSGDAEMGVAASKDNSVRFHTDVNVKFTMTGTTDAGVEFGTNVDLNDIEDPGATSSNGSNDTTNDDDNHGGIAVHMSDPDGFGTLTLGDTDGGYDWAMIEVGSGGIRDDSEHGAWNGNGGLDGKHDGQILRWDRDIAAGFAFGASVELHDHKDNAPSNDPILGFGGTYSMGMGAGTLALGGGVQMGSFLHTIEGGLTAAQRAAEADKPVIWGTATPTPVGTVVGTSPPESVTKGRTVEGREVEGMIVGGSAKMDFGGDGGGISVTLNGSVMEADGSHTTPRAAPATGNRTATADVEKTHLGLGLGYTVGGISLGLNVGSMVTESRVDPDNAATSNTDLVMIDETVTGVGLDVAYDLGGGATLKFGVGSHETEYDYTYQPANDPRSGSTAAGHDYSSDANKWSLGVAFAF